MAVNVEVSNLKAGAAWELVHVSKLSGYCLRGCSMSLPVS